MSAQEIFIQIIAWSVKQTWVRCRCLRTHSMAQLRDYTRNRRRPQGPSSTHSLSHSPEFMSPAARLTDACLIDEILKSNEHPQAMRRVSIQEGNRLVCACAFLEYWSVGRGEYCSILTEVNSK